jgi:hypothetical protein
MGVSGQRHAWRKDPCTHCTGGWVGPRAGVDRGAVGKILSPLPGIEPRSPGRPACSQTLYWLSYPGSHKFFASVGDRTHVVQSVVRHYSDWATPAHSTRLHRTIYQHAVIFREKLHWAALPCYIRRKARSNVVQRDRRNMINESL